MSAIWTPSLWIPQPCRSRLSPWWRLPFHAMAHLKKGPSGHLMKTSSGHLSKGCTPPMPCEACDSTPPETLYVTISGVQICTDCKLNSDLNNYVQMTSAPNGTFELQRRDIGSRANLGGGHYCIWAAAIPNAGANYSDEDCSIFEDPVGWRIEWRVYRVGSIFDPLYVRQLSVWAIRHSRLEEWTTLLREGYGLLTQADSQDSPWDCTDTVMQAAQSSDPSQCSFNGVFGYDGTATIFP